LLVFFSAIAQKKPLDHSVYDGWESISERAISVDGQWIGFVKAVQEGDDVAFLVTPDGRRSITIPRGYNISFNNDGSYAVMLIKPLFADTRAAKIRKLKPEEMPRDSLAIVELASGKIKKIGSVRSYSFPSAASFPLAYLHHPISDTSRKNTPKSDAGGDLVIDPLTDTLTGKAVNVLEYKWNPKGKMLVLEAKGASRSALNAVLIYRVIENRFDTISRGGNEFGNFAIDSTAYQVAFTAERDSSEKSLQKFHKLWYWRNGMDSAVLLADKNSEGMRLGWTISENRELRFSGNGNRLFFGAAPIRPAKDTLTPEIDKVSVDVWHYNDELLMTRQLFQRNAELKRSYLAMYDIPQKRMVQVADEGLKDIVLTNSGDGDLFLGFSDSARNIQSQWTGTVLRDIYAVNPVSNVKTLVKKAHRGGAYLSPAGNYISWYDYKTKQFYTWRNNKTVNVSRAIPFKLFDEEFDMPDDPQPYSSGRWLSNDKGLLVEDRYDVWKLDPDGLSAPVNITGSFGRRNKIRFSLVQVNDEELRDSVYLTSMDERTKDGGLYLADVTGKSGIKLIRQGAFMLSGVMKAKNTPQLVYSRQSFTASPDLYSWAPGNAESKLTALNPQQSWYSWGTVELFRWKAYDGKEAEGLVFKPEGFDPAKKYPMICYFYERYANTLHLYRPPAPVPSRLDISFFVSRGYVVFVPDIRYKTGYPGKGAYDYVVSGARAVARKGWADSTRMGIQGQSWGGYQVVHLITRTNLFKAAWAGAPVANMTSAYGGIRWESGLNRQFQYEKSQSRIGATLWEKPQLYIENSPLFHLPKVKTPLVIMSNDDDGAVPWYQGIELFTAMRRLDKKVWLLNYNGEKHNLVQRKNRKDLSIREQEFFDWMLKGEKPARWLAEGVPATEKS
jgi:dipeptidyl aminopeptidase/acylaminoacyl peptidase